MRKPDYTQLLKVLRKEVPDRPTLFEFFLNGPLYDYLENGEAPKIGDGYDYVRQCAYAYKNAGYDYITLLSSYFDFPSGKQEHLATKSINEGTVITDWESYYKYKWPEPNDFENTPLTACASYLPDGMKFVVYGPGGVLENAIELVGYEQLCMMIYDEPDLLQKIFDDIGSRLVQYYEQSVGHDSVCALISNDDWGFKTQPMLSPVQMRKYVFPWHKKIVEVGHHHNKPVILHSCGMLESVMDDVIVMGYDGKHSFEDAILPIEVAYERYKGRIALLGGIDLHFMCTAKPHEITARTKQIIAKTSHGGYALGTGNSVPEYVPIKNYLAMIDVVRCSL
jgi:uroporphyrinogen decarboxylase